MKKFFQEFKVFISKGSVLDLAVGVVIGAAFQGIIKSLVDDVLMPFISLITGGVDFSNWYVVLTEIPEGVENNAAALKEAGVATFCYGNFISAIIYFLILAFVVFVLVKVVAKAKDLVPHKEAPKEEPTTKKCPFCCTEIDIKATRCPNCTSELPEEEKDKE